MDHFNPFLAHSFVVFKDDRDAKDACDELDGKSMSGDRLTVELARGSGGGGGRGSDRGRFGGGGGRFGGRGGFGRDRDGGYGGSLKYILHLFKKKTINFGQDPTWPTSTLLNFPNNFN